MNGTLVASLLRHRLTSPFRMGLLILAGGSSVLIALAIRSLAPLDSLAGALALLFAAGAIGQDLGSGVLQLTFSRPLTRRSYVVSRWVAAVAGAWAVHTLLLALAGAGLAARGVPLSALSLPVRVLEAGMAVSATCAVLVAFSSLARGLGDLGLYAVSMFAPWVLAQVARARGEAWLERVATELGRTFHPPVALGFLVHGGRVPWDALAAWAATLPLFLGLAIAVMNRREISYGEG